MEEEINYDVMRYELDDEGYLTKVVFGCSTGMCQSYEGEIPEGYESLDEWFDENCSFLNAWKIVSNNLVYDTAKKAQLEKAYEKEQEENRLTHYKEIKNIKSIYKQDLYDMYETSTSEDGSLLELKDANKFEARQIIIKNNGTSISNRITIRSTNANMLPNEATSKIKSGISFIQNEDKTITLNGTSISEIEYDIAGTNENINPIFTFKKGHSYNLSSNDYQVKMYYFDGIERMEVYNGTGGTITFTDGDKKVTHITLIIPNGITKEDEIISLMLNKSTNSNDYVVSEDDEITIDLEEQVFEANDLIMIEDGDVTLHKSTSEEAYYLTSTEMPVTYKELTYIYANEDVILNVTYPNTTKNLEYEGTSTANGTFTVDEEGNITATGGVIGGFTINKSGLNSKLTPPETIPNYEYDYTNDDLEKIQSYLSNTYTLTDEEKILYDLNGDGAVTTLDLLRLNQILLTGVTHENAGKFEINTNDPLNTIVLKSSDGTEKININLLGIKINGMHIVPKSLMTIGLGDNASYTVSATWTDYVASLTEFKNSTGDGLFFEDGGIKIGSNISKVTVSANVLLRGIVGTLYVTILKNGIPSSSAYYQSTNANTWESRTMSPMLIDVEENDLITLGYGAGAKGTIQFGGDPLTYLTVEVAE